MESSWFKKGFNSKSDQMKREITNVASVDSNEVVSLCGNESAANEANQALVNPSFLNAFDIISLSAVLDLSASLQAMMNRKMSNLHP